MGSFSSFLWHVSQVRRAIGWPLLLTVDCHCPSTFCRLNSLYGEVFMPRLVSEFRIFFLITEYGQFRLHIHALKFQEVSNTLGFPWTLKCVPILIFCPHILPFCHSFFHLPLFLSILTLVCLNNLFQFPFQGRSMCSQIEPSKATQTQKDKYAMYSIVSRCYLLSKG